MKIRKYLVVPIAVYLYASVSGADNNFYRDIIRLDNCTQKIHQNYIDSIPSSALVNGAISGMLRMLDDNSVYFINDEVVKPVSNSPDSMPSSDKNFFTGVLLISLSHTKSPFGVHTTLKMITIL